MPLLLLYHVTPPRGARHTSINTHFTDVKILKRSVFKGVTRRSRVERKSLSLLGAQW